MMFINETFSIYQKIGIVFAFMIYPYVIRIIEKMLIFVYILHLKYIAFIYKKLKKYRKICLIFQTIDNSSPSFI